MSPPAEGDNEAEAEEELPALMLRIKAAQPPPEVLKVTMASHCSLFQHGLPNSIRRQQRCSLEGAQGALASLKRGHLSWCTSRLCRPCRKCRRWGRQITDAVPV